MLAPGDTLQNDRYHIVRLIMLGGAVYQAYDNNFKYEVALKEALVSDPVLRRAFEKEAQRLVRLHHSALPNVSDYFVEGPRQYLVMRFIEGQNLAEMLYQRGRAFEVKEVLTWAKHLLDALEYLHGEGVVHRDIKPANINLTPKGKLFLLDLGLAKGGLTQNPISGHSLIGFTIGYAPPEQMAIQPTNAATSMLWEPPSTLY